MPFEGVKSSGFQFTTQSDLGKVFLFRVTLFLQEKGILQFSEYFKFQFTFPRGKSNILNKGIM